MFIFIYLYCVCVQKDSGVSLPAVFNEYEDAFSGTSETCVWISVGEKFFPLLPSADYTEYLICFSNWHSRGFGNAVKKDVRRS